jgi:hypothetical protein
MEERSADSRGLFVLISILVLVISTSCDPTVPVQSVFRPGRLRIQVQLLSPTVGGSAVFKLVWAATWLSFPTDMPAGAQYQGDTAAGGTLNLGPADIAQTNDLVTFPDSGNLRAGVWQIAILVVGNGSNQIMSTSCNQEVFAGRTDPPTELKFSEGGTGCTCVWGCSAF